jgi:hypothetical protein
VKVEYSSHIATIQAWKFDYVRSARVTRLMERHAELFDGPSLLYELISWPYKYLLSGAKIALPVTALPSKIICLDLEPQVSPLVNDCD